MFYSHSYLARKGPLATVWLAAHLQHKLKKSHYTSTDISSTVERILFPDAPIALRMSGHLLLGVVRIYSKKVDYLFQDCNIVLIGLSKAFSRVEVNLPEGATHAPFHSITLPETFELDTLDLHDNFYEDGSLNKHFKSMEEITLIDQIPIGRDPYVVITFDQDVAGDSAHLEDASESGAGPMEEDPITEQPGPNNNQIQERENPNEDRVPQDIPGYETIREPVPDNYVQNPLILSEGDNDKMEPDSALEEEIMKDCEVNNLTVEEISGSGQHFRRSQTQQEPASAALGQASDHQIQELENPNEDRVSQDIPDFETFREAVPDTSLGNPLILSKGDNDKMEPDNALEEEIMKDCEVSNSTAEEISGSGQHFRRSQTQQEPASVALGQASDHIDAPTSFGHESPQLAPTPPVQQQPKARARKRKQVFDETTVLTNKSMKKSLEDTRDLLRRRKDCPSSSLGLWKLNVRLRKENIFNDSVLSGLSADLCDLYKKDYISGKPHLISVEQPPAPSNEPGIEIEQMQNYEGPANENFMTEGPEHNHPPSEDRMSSSPSRFTSSPRSRDFTPASTTNLGTESKQVESTFGTIGSREQSTPDQAASTGDTWFFEERLGFDNTGLSDIPEHSPGDLNFLEEDNNTPTGSQGTPEVDFSLRKHTGTSEVHTLSARTRAVARYLKEQSSATPTGEDPSECLSFNKIVEGKRRKICSRMFFETLVLKNCGLVDVHQEEAYGDISLKVTPRLAKEQFSS